MQLECPRCQRVLEFSGERPSFCGYCGVPLPKAELGATVTLGEVATVARPATVEGQQPQSVRGYRLVRRLGAGGMGTVFEAEETATGRRVALKLIAGQVAESAEVVERFRREGQLASTIAHPRCVFVLAADEDAGRPFIVMELMPGSTLKDLVDQQGPLAPEQAIAKILDVIEGLQEAHRLGVLHRDVKPSNCFLEADGRVKVGDFGLARSLAVDAHLTATGAFLGTPLFASPEQLKGEPIDVRSDVYSVAATLYYLLTGRAPFQGSDLASLAIRVATEPAPSVRSLRPHLSPALDRVVLRGLERNRERRWHALDEFRLALLPFAPGRLSIGGMGSRIGAYLIDYLGITIILNALMISYYLSTGQLRSVEQWASLGSSPVLAATIWLIWIAYFGVLEGVWGCSIGKWLLGLRVCAAMGSDPPGLWKGVWRSFVGLVFLDLGGLPFAVGALLGVFPTTDPEKMQQLGWIYAALGFAFYPLEALGICLLACTMRARNGYRGTHDFLSGTRVIRLPQAESRRSLPSQGLELTHPDGAPERIAAYEICGAVCWSPIAKILIGEDAALRRRVLIWLRPTDAPPVSPARRENSRTARLRWLACGHLDALQWDAFLAPAAQPLRNVVAGAGKLAWTDARSLLEQLADELATASAEGTLPESLSIDQVWVQPNGMVQLLEMPTAEQEGADKTHSREQRSLAVLAEVAVLTLEGRHSSPSRDREGAVHAPLPQHASRLVGRLLDCPERYADVPEFQGALAATRGRPVEVTRGRRLGHLVLLTTLLSLGLCFCMLPAGLQPGFVIGMNDLASVRQDEETLKQLEAGMTSDYFVAGLDPNPFVRLHANRQLEDDLLLHDRLEQKVAHLRREREAHLHSIGWSSRQFILFLMNQEEKQRSAGAGAGPRVTSPSNDFRTAAQEAVEDRGGLRDEITWISLISVAALLLPWPILWAIWSFAFRGGWSLRFLDLALVRRDGRPAGRLQCAWRTLMVWAPVAVCLGLSAWLEMKYWASWDEFTSHEWLMWLSRVSWWLAIALLVAYVVVPLWSPSRSLHDRLAGTYVVPR